MATEGETIIVNKEKYFYMRCNRAIKNADVKRSRPVKGKRLINEDYEESGPVTRNIVKKEMKRGQKRKCNELHQENYIYVRCNRAIKNAVKSRHANVNGSRPVKGKRMVNEDYEESGPATRNIEKKEMKGGHKRKCNKLHDKNSARRIEENNSDDDTSTEMEILDMDEVIKRGLSNLFFPDPDLHPADPTLPQPQKRGHGRPPKPKTPGDEALKAKTGGSSASGKRRQPAKVTGEEGEKKSGKVKRGRGCLN